MQQGVVVRDSEVYQSEEINSSPRQDSWLPGENCKLGIQSVTERWMARPPLSIAIDNYSAGYCHNHLGSFSALPYL